MRRRLAYIVVIIGIGISPPGFAVEGLSDADPVRHHEEQSFEPLSLHSRHMALTTSGPSPQIQGHNNGYSPDQYVIGIGQGDLSKGPIVCQRVSELSARADLAKQIRIFVKEHMVDRIRERPGHVADQDIELTREEIVQEYLEGVKIIDHHVDERKNICSATAVMPKNKLQPSSPSNVGPPLPSMTR